MRSHYAFVAVVLSSALLPSPVLADAVLQTLPEDGAWVQFHVNLKIGGQVSDPVWTLKSVGTKQVGGDACRWIELQSKHGERNVVLFKCLVAESEFGKGKDPLAAARQVFVKNFDQEPREVQSVAAADPVLALILSGPAQAKKLDVKEAVDVQKGRIECEVFTGTSQGEIGGTKFELEHQLLMSDEVPYGVAAARFRVNVAGNAFTASVDCVQKDSGKDAKSALPGIE